MEHQRSYQPCERQDGPLPDSISEQQWEKLNQQYQSRGKSVEDQWMDIWDILFPKSKPPKSVYLDSHLVEETLSRLRAFWQDRCTEITDSTIRQSGGVHKDATNLVFHLFDKLIDGFLGQFEAETVGSRSCGFARPEATPQLPYIYNPEWEDSLNIGPVAAGGTSFAMDSDSVFQTYDSRLELEPEAPPSWPPQPYVADFPLSRPVCASTNLSPGFPFESKQSQHNQLATEMYASGPPSTSGDTLMVLASGLTLPQHRHTWSGPDSTPWYTYSQRGLG